MEKEFVSWLIKNHSATADPVEIGLGDDAAVVNLHGPIVIATDTISDNVHFKLDDHSLTQIGHKAMAVNLSDIAAMGAQPIAATVNLVCPKSLMIEQLKELFDGMWQCANRFGVQIIGGDTNRWDGGLVVGATVFGTTFKNAKSGFWKMNTAKPGDSILVTGSFGGSIAGKHIDFEPRVSAAKHLIENYNISAATDVSDSLSIDLAAIALQSGCGFQLQEQDIPISAAALDASKNGKYSALAHALYDGEDFELILCASPSEAEKIVADSKLKTEITHIGTLNNSQEFTITNRNTNSSRRLEIRGFVH